MGRLNDDLFFLKKKKKKKIDGILILYFID